MMDARAAIAIFSLLAACSSMRSIEPEEPSPASGTAVVESARTRGAPDASIVVYEFSDFQCPVTARHASEILPRLESGYLRSGRIRYVFRDLPLVGIHPRALAAAIAARCAAEQGRFWEMHGRLLQNQRALGEAELASHAQAIGLELGPFQRCRAESESHLVGIRADIAFAAEHDLDGTPSFLIGIVRDSTRGDAGVEIVERVRGVSSYGGFAAAIERAGRRSDGAAHLR